MGFVAALVSLQHACLTVITYAWTSSMRSRASSAHWRQLSLSPHEFENCDSLHGLNTGDHTALAPRPHAHPLRHLRRLLSCSPCVICSVRVCIALQSTR